jgi:hypothetical protein
VKCKVSISALNKKDCVGSFRLLENATDFAGWRKGEINRPFLSDNDEKVSQNAADFLTANGKAKWPTPVCTS